MSRLSKKEIILLSAMVVTVAYGAFQLFVPSPSKSAGLAVSGGAGAVVTEISNKLAKEMPSVADKYIVSQAEGEWSKDPFVGRGASRNEASKHYKTGGLNQIKSFNYTGYLEMGDRKMAIINGLEYGVGEQVDSSGNFIESINPSRIIIENRDKKTKQEFRLKD